MIGHFIRYLLDQGYTQTQIAKTFNVSQATVSDYLHNKLNPRIDKIPILADHFHVSTDFIFGRTNNPEPPQ